jgi:hypothetical protein
MKTIAKYVSAGILAVLLGGDAIAEDIYSQTFAASPPIVGTTSTTGGGTWAGSNIIDLNGNTTGVDGAVSLPFTPQSGFVYELTATIDVTAANGSWVGVGFLESNNAYGFFGAPTTPTALRTSGWQTFAGPGANYTQTSNEVLIRLDTTGAQWTVAMFQGGIQMGSTFTYATNPTINHVGFVSEGTAVGSVSAFQLTAVSNSPTFATWASTNAGGQTANLDWDNDGVTNGVEFFMNAAPGFTSNPGLNGLKAVTWPNGGNIPSSAYGTQFVVQVSTNLTTWEDVSVGNLDSNTDGPGGSLSYTVSGPDKQFVRLKVTPN